MIKFFLDHYVSIAIVFSYVLIAVSNGLMKYPQTENVKKWVLFIHIVVDLLSPITRKNSPNSLKSLFTLSKDPDEQKLSLEDINA